MSRLMKLEELCLLMMNHIIYLLYGVLLGLYVDLIWNEVW